LIHNKQAKNTYLFTDYKLFRGHSRLPKNPPRKFGGIATAIAREPVNSSHGQLVTPQNGVPSWLSCLTALWRVDRTFWPSIRRIQDLRRHQWLQHCTRFNNLPCCDVTSGSCL